MYGRMSANNALSARLIGEIFLERGLVTEEQLQAALEMQKETKEHLGELLVAHFGVSRIDLASVLAEQWAELERTNAAAGGPPTPPLTAVQSEPTAAGEEPEPQPQLDETEPGDEPHGERRPLGEIFVEQGLVTDEEIDRALQTQRESGDKLGEILVAQGSITRLQLASALAEQWTALRKIRPPSASALEPAKPIPLEVVREAPPEDVDRLHEAVDALEQRLRAAESIAAREPWREEIGAATEGLQKTIAALEARLEAAETARGDEADAEAAAEEIAPVRAALDELAERVDVLAATEHAVDPDLLRRIEAAADAAEAARTGLGGAFESLSLRLSDVEARVHDRSDLTGLREEIEALGTRISELGGPAEDPAFELLRDEVRRLADEVTRRAEAPAADSTLAPRVDALAERVDELAGTVKGEKSGKVSKSEVKALEDTVTKLGAQVQELANDSKLGLQDLRQTVGEIQARPQESDLAERLSHYGAGAAQVDELKGRLAELEAQTAELIALRETVDELAARPPGDPELAARFDELVRAVDEKVAPRPQVEALREQVDELAAQSGEVAAEVRRRVDALAEQAWAPADDLAELRSELTALGSRVEALARTSNEAATHDQVEDLTARMRELEAAQPQEELAELKREVSGLAARASSSEEVTRVGAELASLARRVEELADRAGDAVASERFEDLSSRVGAELDRLRRTLDELEARPVPDADLLDSLARRVEELAGHPAAIDELRAELSSMAQQAARPSEEVEGLRTETASRLAALEESIRTAAATDRLDEVGRRVDALAERVDAPSEDVAALRPELAALAARLEELAARPSANVPTEYLDELTRRTGALEEIARATAADERLGELRSQVEALAERMAVPSEDVTGLRVDLAGLATRLDELAARPTGGLSGEELAELRARVSAIEEAPQETRTDEQLDALRRQVEALSERMAAPSQDVATLRTELAALAVRLDEVTAQPRPSVPTEHLDELTRRLAAVEESARATVTGEQLEEIRARVAELAERNESPGAVDELAARLRALEEGASSTTTEEQLEELRGRLASLSERMEKPSEDVAELRAELTALTGTVQPGKRTRKDLESLRNDLDELSSRIESPSEELVRQQAELARLGERLEEVAARPAGDPALAERVEDVAATLESAARVADEGRAEAAQAVETAVGEIRSEVADIAERLVAAEERAAQEPPDEHGPRLDSLEQRIVEITASASERQAELGRDLEGAVSQLREEVAAQRAEVASRADGVEREAALLGEQLSELRAALEAQAESRAVADAELGERLDAVAGSVEREASAQEELTSTVGEVRTELGALAARLDQSAAATGDVLRALRSEVAEVSSLARPAEEPTELETELRARVEELERRLEEPPQIDREVAEPVDEPALETVAQPEPEPVGAGAYLAFVPNDQGYSLHELDGPLPAVGQSLPGSAGEEGFVVARVGRSPLPLDRRQCVYLELAVVADPSDRVT